MALLGLTVAACGLRGDLVRPAPASGEDTRVADETEASEEAKARAARARLAQQADQAEASAQQQAASK
jgi:predicted small lipoprotein YifL